MENKLKKIKETLFTVGFFFERRTFGNILSMRELDEKMCTSPAGERSPGPRNIQTGIRSGFFFFLYKLNKNYNVLISKLRRCLLGEFDTFGSARCNFLFRERTC